MISKGERTRHRIIQSTAALMNQRGFASTPVAEVMAASGIQKGGLYRHFESREALAFEAMDYAVLQVRNRFEQALQGQHHACDRLLALLNAHAQDSIEAVPFIGGCPIMNTAIEADHAHPGLRQRAQAAMSGWHGLLRQIVTQGQRGGEVDAHVDAAEVATLFIACIEGALMLSHLYGDASHLQAARRHLTRYINSELRQTKEP